MIDRNARAKRIFEHERAIIESLRAASGRSMNEHSEQEISLGQINYAAYAKAVGGLTWDKREMPKWDELTDKIRSAWIKGGIAVAVNSVVTVSGS